MRFLFIFFIQLIMILTKNVNAEDINAYSKSYSVWLKAGTILTKISDQTIEVLPNGIFVKVLETNPNRRDIFNVYNKNGLAEYTVPAESVHEYANETRLLPIPETANTNAPKSIFKNFNPKAIFDSQISIHFDSLQVSALNTIYNDETAVAPAVRYEARTLLVSQLPLKFGICLNYQSAYWKNENENIKLSILSFGPQFGYPLYDENEFKFLGLISAEYAPIYEGSTELYHDKYSAMLFDLGLETQWKTNFGVIVLGGHLRHHSIALTDTDRPSLELTPKEFSLNSLGVVLGYKIEWSL